jgi:hypothetical protein
MPQLIKHFKRAILGLFGLALLLYAGDAISLRMRLPAGLDSVPVQPYYAIPQKDGKTEFVLADPETLTCAHSLFPQLGYKPCWYVSRHRQVRMDE